MMKSDSTVENIVYRGITLLLAIALFAGSCSRDESASDTTEPAAGAQTPTPPPEWTKHANIYEVNIRQYTREGTFKAFQQEVPRLKKMGVDILWLMPIHPIGEKNRKGELGSYYSIKDYHAINPNYGTLENFKALVKSVHDQDMKLIIDWVPNHTAWDHPWITEHPEYYAKDSTGQITYEADWTDIALLDYSNEELQQKMMEAMSYWVSEANIDGFRVDHAAHEIPMSFWKKAIPEVDKKKEGLFWLAEWNDPQLHPVFDASYPWDYFHLTTSIAQGEESAAKLDDYMKKEQQQFPESAYRMYFTTNHDENSWNGTDEELFGNNFENFAVLAFTIDGMPLIYSGQETALDKQLEFFKKDPIDWAGYEYADFYATLIDLKDRNEALWNGEYGGEFQPVDTNFPKETYAFKRVKDENEVFVILNLSDATKEISFPDISEDSEYRDVFSDKKMTVGSGSVSLDGHSYLVLEK